MSVVSRANSFSWSNKNRSISTKTGIPALFAPSELPVLDFPPASSAAVLLTCPSTLPLPSIRRNRATSFFTSLRTRCSSPRTTWADILLASRALILLGVYLLTKVEGSESDTLSMGVVMPPVGVGVGVDVRVEVGVGDRFSDMLMLELPRPALGSSSGELGRANPSRFSECARPTAPYQHRTLDTMVVSIRAVCKFSEQGQSKMRCTALTVSLLVAKT